MKRKINLLIVLVFSFLLICIYLTKNVTASSIDITTSTVRDDLESMEKDNLSTISSTDNIFITFNQYYDSNNVLRTYLYMNYIEDDYLDLYVNLSMSVSDQYYNITEDYHYYKLSFVNKDEECFWTKFEVLGLDNLTRTTRRYKIDGVYKAIYDPIFSDYTYESLCITEDVFIFNGINNKQLQFFYEDVETITITEKEVKVYCYGKEADFLGFWKNDKIMQYGDIYHDSWYILFNADKPIDELLEAEITYQKFKYTTKRNFNIYTMDYDFTEEELLAYKNSDNDYADKTTLNYYEQKNIIVEPGEYKVSYLDKKWYSSYKVKYETLDNILDLKKYKYEKGDDFCFSAEAEKYQWAVHFMDSQRICEYGTNVSHDTPTYKGYGIKNAAILRLRFVSNGLKKNLYAIDEPTDDFDSVGVVIPDDNDSLLTMIIKLIGILVIIMIVASVIKIISPLGNIITTIILLPFKLIDKIFGKKKQ